jgi:hypothetical protein
MEATTVLVVELKLNFINITKEIIIVDLNICSDYHNQNLKRGLRSKPIIFNLHLICYIFVLQYPYLLTRITNNYSYNWKK